MLPKKKTVKKTPWPTRKAMQQVYEVGLWGSNDTAFYSGEGSHEAHIIRPYIDTVSDFLRSFETPLSVCDLGCGDFNVGKELVPLSRKLTAIDIVPELIHHNKTIFQHKNLEFQCMDIAKDDLPEADCAILRQVLQHLSNAEIRAILEKLRQYKYIILTEHLPDGDFEFNLDIISGQGTRLKKGSGVDVLTVPFYFKVKQEKELVTIDLGQEKGRIRTVLFTLK